MLGGQEKCFNKYCFFSAEMYSKDEKNIFVEAKKFGIHRTVHAGEGGPAANVIAVSQFVTKAAFTWAASLIMPDLHFWKINQINKLNKF